MQMQIPQETGMEYVPQILPEHFFTAPVAPAAAPAYAAPTEAMSYRKTVRNTALYNPQPQQLAPAYAAPKVRTLSLVLTYMRFLEMHYLRMFHSFISTCYN